MEPTLWTSALQWSIDRCFRRTPVAPSHSLLSEGPRFFPHTENSTAHATTSTWTCLPPSSWEPWPCWWRTSSSTTLTPRGPTMRKSGYPTCQRYILPCHWPPTWWISTGGISVGGWGVGKGKRERYRGVRGFVVRDALKNKIKQNNTKTSQECGAANLFLIGKAFYLLTKELNQVNLFYYHFSLKWQSFSP